MHASPPAGGAAVLLLLSPHRCTVMPPAPNSRAVISTLGIRHLGSRRLLLFFFHNNRGISYPPPSLPGISKEALLFCTKAPGILQ